MPEDANLPVWDGNREKLPELYQKFVFEGRQYLLLKIDGEITVYDIEDEDYSPAMEVRMLGEKSGIAMANVFIKSGVATVDEAARAFEPNGIDLFQDLTGRLGRLAEDHVNDTDPLAFLTDKGVTQEELEETAERMMGLARLLSLVTLARSPNFGSKLVM